jgi:hypothetical protein
VTIEEDHHIADQHQRDRDKADSHPQPNVALAPALALSHVVELHAADLPIVVTSQTSHMCWLSPRLRSVRWWEDWCNHGPAIITLVVVLFSLRTIPRIVSHPGFDYRVVEIWIALDVGLVCWALWHELRNRRKRD